MNKNQKLIQFEVSTSETRKWVDVILAKNAVNAAKKLGGKLVNSSPNWGLVQYPDGSTVQITWETNN